MQIVACLCLAVTILASPGVASEYFKDVPKEHWAAESVDKLAEIGIVKGYPDNVFRGDKLVTRYELAMVLQRFIEYMRESWKPISDGNKQDKPTDVCFEKAINSQSATSRNNDPFAFLRDGGFLTEDSVLLQNDRNKPVTVDQLAQTLATVAAKLNEERIPVDK